MLPDHALAAAQDEANRQGWNVDVMDFPAVLRAAFRAAGSAQLAGDPEPTEAYWAVAANGQRCAFGIYSFAKNWAGPGGTVETVQLRQLTLVEPAAAPQPSGNTGELAQGEDSARLDWRRLTAPGQVKVGDKLRFTIGDEQLNERVKQIINPGYPDEELIYNKRRNFYVITSNAITNFGSSKNVEFLARASAETGGVKS